MTERQIVLIDKDGIVVRVHSDYVDELHLPGLVYKTPRADGVCGSNYPRTRADSIIVFDEWGRDIWAESEFRKNPRYRSNCFVYRKRPQLIEVKAEREMVYVEPNTYVFRASVVISGSKTANESVLSGGETVSGVFEFLIQQLNNQVPYGYKVI